MSKVPNAATEIMERLKNEATARANVHGTGRAMQVIQNTQVECRVVPCVVHRGKLGVRLVTKWEINARPVSAERTLWLLAQTIEQEVMA